jgi:hypothetical protein
MFNNTAVFSRKKYIFVEGITNTFDTASDPYHYRCSSLTDFAASISHHLFGRA